MTLSNPNSMQKKARYQQWWSFFRTAVTSTVLCCGAASLMYLLGTYRYMQSRVRLILQLIIGDSLSSSVNTQRITTIPPSNLLILQPGTLPPPLPPPQGNPTIHISVTSHPPRAEVLLQFGAVASLWFTELSSLIRWDYCPRDYILSCRSHLSLSLSLFILLPSSQSFSLCHSLFSFFFALSLFLRREEMENQRLPRYSSWWWWEWRRRLWSEISGQLFLTHARRIERIAVFYFLDFLGRGRISLKESFIECFGRQAWYSSVLPWFTQTYLI